jgi:hypothetical protein
MLAQAFAKLLQLAGFFQVAMAAQLIGLTGSETGRYDGQLHHLLLKNGHPMCA